jgi:hypothetical protein
MASSQVAHQRLVVGLLIAVGLRMIAPIFMGAAIQWTPAACCVAFQSFLLLMTGLQLVSGHSDSFFKNEPHTGKIPSPETKRAFEIGVGGALLHWGAGFIACLLAGGAQVACRVNLAPMLICTYYHYAAGAMANVKANCVIIALMVFFGFGYGQESTLEVAVWRMLSFEWTSASCFLVFQASLCLLCGLVFLLRPEAFYTSKPHIKELIGGSRQGELFEVGVLSAMGCTLLGAVMAGGAQDMCILQLPGLLACTYSHHVMGAKQDVAVNATFIVILAYLGLAR